MGNNPTLRVRSQHQSTQKEKLKSNFEIFVITYNRSAELMRTITAIKESVLCEIKLTVLNNCSTDDTIEIVEKLKKKYENINLVTNSCNIGANANILRPVELSESEYTWILCDDDDYNFEQMNDVLQVMSNATVDLIHVGAHPAPWHHGGQYDTPSQLMIKGYHYFMFGSFLPCNIFRTSLFRNKYLIKGYNNIVNSYPHMPYIQDIYSCEKQIYISKHKIITARIGNQSYDTNEWLIWWMRNSMLLKDIAKVRQAFFDHFDHSLNKNLIDTIKGIRVHDRYNKMVVDVFIKRYFTKYEKICVWGFKDFFIASILGKLLKN